MKRLLILAFALLFALPAIGQRYRNPSQYFRQFANENRKIDRKNLIFFTALLKGEELRRTDKYREMVLDQLKDSKKAVERVGVYEDYDILQREYIAGLEDYIKAYSVGFDSALAHYGERFQNYDTLKLYHQLMSRAEGRMLKASYRLRSAEDHFAKTYYLQIERDPETEEKLQQIDQLTLFTREMDLSFFKVHQQLSNWLTAIEQEQRDTLHNILTSLRRNIVSAGEQVQEYEEFEMDDYLYDEVRDYLEDVSDEVDESLRPLADAFSNAYLDPREYRKAENALESVQRWHQGSLEDYLEARADLIEDYFPD